MMIFLLPSSPQSISAEMVFKGTLKSLVDYLRWEQKCCYGQNKIQAEEPKVESCDVVADIAPDDEAARQTEVCMKAKTGLLHHHFI